MALGLTWKRLRATSANKALSRYQTLQARYLHSPTRNYPAALWKANCNSRASSAAQTFSTRWTKSLLPSSAASLSPEAGLKIFALCGIGGVRKTSIAAHFVASRRKLFDAILWLRADTSSKVTDRFAEFAVSLGLQEAEDAQGQALSQKLVMSWLTNPIVTYNSGSPLYNKKASWLIVFDNTDDPSILRRFWPTKGMGSIIVTSRDPLAAKPAYYPQRPLRLDGLQLKPFFLPDATRFLVEQAPDGHNPDDPKSTEELAGRLDGLPLALVQMAGIVSRRDLFFSEFLEMYEDEVSHFALHKEQIPQQTSGYEYNLATVWAIDSLQGEALILMNVISLLDPDHIEESILLEGSNRVEDEDYPKTLDAFHRARTKLWETSLVYKDRQNRPLNIHRVVQDTTRTKMSLNQSKAAFQAATALLLAAWPSRDRLWLPSVSD